MERKRWVQPLAATRILRSLLVPSKSPGVAGTKAPTLSDLWLGRRILRCPSLFPFPFLQRSHHEQRPPQREGDLWLYGCLRRYGELVLPQDEARPESK